MKDKEEVEIVNSFQELTVQYKKLQNVALNNLSKLIKDGLEELIEETEENSKKVKLSEYLVLKYIS
ncbi:MAG: hypothetical protein CEE43_12315 [Promethearchaeota archaeon Loki_b32]|nr:MAG: hypothetical protein CEE43_12315 [Candidatus Lokiarchaeota archaeon Loki_b32]